MDAKSILESLNTGRYRIEHTVREENNETIIVGYLQATEDASGFGRYEFAITEKDEQEMFVEGYTTYLRKIIG